MPKWANLPARQDEVDHYARHLLIKHDRYGSSSSRSEHQQNLHDKYAFQVSNDSFLKAFVKKVVDVIHSSARFSLQEPDRFFKPAIRSVYREHFLLIESVTKRAH